MDKRIVEAKNTGGLLAEMLADPQILSFVEECAQIKASGPHFCANRAWSGEGLKENLVQLVGWEAAKFKTPEHYNALYSFAYDLLPGCRECDCF